MHRHQVYTLLERCAGWLLPPQCVLCRGPGQPPALDLCAACEAEFPLVPDPCPRCGLPREWQEGQEEGCVHCRALDLPYSRCVAPWVYEFPVTQLVQALKYEGALAHARVFGTRLAAQALHYAPATWQGALLVPMPLHPSRLVERGYNQSHEIARVVSRRLHLRLAGHGLRRVRETAPQVGLSRVERQRNLHGAFAACPQIVAGQHVILLDDVVTTGSTVLEAASTLRAAGAADVSVWAVARVLG